ncbi:MAG: DUF4474 domain-containing protein [Oscillospiraceae bacterium]|jgi:hypothetical protein|nr:DUF4474 domain-containing protein [Oscillospiraceae bacterium]
MKTKLKRALCLLFACLFFASAGTVSVFADEQGVNNGVNSKNPWVWFFDNTNFLSFMSDPSLSYYYITQKAWQHNFGYNKVYDALDFTMNCYIDTLRPQFVYDGQEWMMQMWKGQYGIILLVGAEVGIYTRPIGGAKNSDGSPNEFLRSIDHYNCAAKKDWMNMTMTLYEDTESGEIKRFTRPWDKYWWVTGFQWGTTESFFIGPRRHCRMYVTIEMKSNEMAKLYGKALEKYGFKYSENPHQQYKDLYKIEGAKITINWQQATESVW